MKGISIIYECILIVFSLSGNCFIHKQIKSADEPDVDKISASYQMWREGGMGGINMV